MMKQVGYICKLVVFMNSRFEITVVKAHNVWVSSTSKCLRVHAVQKNYDGGVCRENKLYICGKNCSACMGSENMR